MVLKEKINELEVVEADMLLSAIKYWHTDNEFFRSPFPNYVQESSGKEAISAFIDWTKSIPADEAKKMEQDVFIEKFEELLFNAASKLVKTEDEKLTLLYPFLPRLGDTMSKSHGDNTSEDGQIIDRSIIKSGDESFLELKVKSNISDEIWKTSFELPI
ncbi:MAG: hypothetical protein JNK41_12525 [Saprospiraceae bacterium]|nr:hypothetical protein [Saprospiraceae bacterium]MBX7093762.1 hypothetical protein [Flavobacteriales bacterium]